MLAAGTADGTVQCWDPRMRTPLGTALPFDEPDIAHAAAAAPTSAASADAAADGLAGALPLSARAAASAPSAREVTALRFDDRGLTLAAGTSTGHVALYDLRRARPMIVKDHMNGLPITDLKFHIGTGHVVSTDAKAIKVWERDGGRTFTTIQPPADVNDVALFPNSGMIFAALETERLGAYFVPSLGPAPRWCHFLDAMTEEMEEASTQTSLYDDYKFVTRDELSKLGLDSLVGTGALRPYMHGFFIDAKLHTKAVSLSQPFAYEQWRQERLQQKLSAKTAGRIAPVVKAKPKVNAELAAEIQKGRCAPQSNVAKPASTQTPTLNQTVCQPPRYAPSPAPPTRLCLTRLPAASRAAKRRRRPPTACALAICSTIRVSRLSSPIRTLRSTTPRTSTSHATRTPSSRTLRRVTKRVQMTTRTRTTRRRTRRRRTTRRRMKTRRRARRRTI
jgi:hypothetical protein